MLGSQSKAEVMLRSAREMVTMDVDKLQMAKKRFTKATTMRRKERHRDACLALAPRLSQRGWLTSLRTGHTGLGASTAFAAAR